ncbi:MAG: tetratricopeptide repeat protein [bacterium]|nr:tetratricopeptide repeat protein [bacterium]
MPPTPGNEAALSPSLREAIGHGAAEVRADPSGSAAWLELGMTYEANALDGIAEETYALGARIGSGDGRLPYHLARLRALRGDLDGALEASAEAARRSPEYGPIHWRRGGWMLTQGRLDAAAEAFERAEAIDPKDPAGRWGLARVALESGQPSRALAALAPLTERAPDYAYTHHLLASAHRAAGDRERAARETALAGKPVWNDAWEHEIDAWRVGYHADVARAKDAVRSGDSETAAALLEALRVSAPGDINVYGMLSDVYLERGELDRARSLLVQARERFPDHHRIALNLADVHERAGENGAALEEIEACLALHATYAPAHLRHGRLLMKHGKNADAVRAFEQARTLGNLTLPLAQMLGVALARTGAWDRAAHVFADGAALHPNSLDLALMEAEAQARSGAAAAAWSALARAERQGGDAARVAATRTKLVHHLGEERQ